MTNRQEVAEKLREAGKELDNTFDESDDGDEFLAVFIATDLAIGQPKRSPFEFSPFFNRLADLIDPTCEVVGVPDNDEFMVRVVSGFMCKKCGYEVIVERNCDGWAEPPNYCPNCGARVVRDEA